VMLRCPGCQARVDVSAAGPPALRLDRKPYGTVIIYDWGTPVHSFDLERARSGTPSRSNITIASHSAQ
jgi:hypothetical protein